MVVAPEASIKIPIPSNVNMIVENDKITVKGPNGTLSRVFTHPKITIKKLNNEVEVYCKYPRRKEKALVGTFAAHINNMIKGVTDGFQYKLKIVYAHFPIKVSLTGKTIRIENFLGERTPRYAQLVGDTKVMIKPPEILLVGNNKEDVGQSAANIEKATRIKNKDPRVFQDGIYIVEKG
jgi:large subunit ribosomal protein L6